MVESVKDPEIIKLLLKHRPICPITQEVICNFSKNFRSSGRYYGECELLRLLLDHEKDMPITPIVMSIVIRTGDR